MKAALPILLLPALLLAALLPATLAAREASASGTATASIVQPLTIAALADLDFGGLALAAGAAGQITIDPASGAAHYQGTTPALCPSGACLPHAARFRVRGEAGRGYRLVLPLSANALPVAGVGPALVVSAMVAASANLPGGGGHGLLDGAGADELTVGGTLAVPAGTAPGRYLAQVPVLVSYD